MSRTYRRNAGETTRRKKSIKRTEREIAQALANLNGLRRLKSVTNEQWDKAIQQELEEAANATLAGTPGK